VKLPTWGELHDYHCTIKTVDNTRFDDTPYGTRTTKPNPFYEDMASRRYNYASASDSSAFRLVFLKDVLRNPDNKTLIRKGRFIWCKNIKYEGRNKEGLRQISFTVDRGKKRFFVSENNVLCVPSKTFINNNRFFRAKEKTFIAFSSVFSYSNTFNMMLRNSSLDRQDFQALIDRDNPYKPGTLVAPRLGYFYPQAPDVTRLKPPYGIIIGHSFDNNDYSGREFYRVKFGETTYERVNPIQMEVINEV
jgi:hypothetical protein